MPQPLQRVGVDIVGRLGEQRLEVAFRLHAVRSDQRGRAGVGGLIVRIAANRRKQGELVERAKERNDGRR